MNSKFSTSLLFTSLIVCLFLAFTTKSVKSAGCEIWGTCSQKCEHSGGSSPSPFNCSCQTGFKLLADNRTCDVTDPNVLLIYATRNSVGVLSLEDKRYYSINENRGSFVSVAVNVWDGIVLWTDVVETREAIYQRSIHGNGTIEKLVDSGIDLVEGLCVDWITGNLYFVDSSKKHLVVCSKNGFNCAIIGKEYLESPREVCLDPNEGFMFWSNWGERGSIVKAQMDGANANRLVVENVFWPNGLAIDVGSGRLYWSDAKSDVIETTNLDGSDRRIIRSAPYGHHFKLTVFGDTLYWSDWEASEIQSCNKFTGQDVNVLVAGRGRPTGLAIFHPSAQPRLRENQCTGGAGPTTARCSHLCLLIPNDGHSCACPIGLKLDGSGKDCIDDENTPRIAIGYENKLGLYRDGGIGRKLVEEFELPTNTVIGAIQYNAINHTIFVSDTFSHQIYEYDPKTQKIDYIAATGHVDKVTGLSLDVIGQNLYWVDAGSRKVEVLSLKSRARCLISEESDFPQDLIVIPEKKFLFVTLTSSKFGQIVRYSMDGHNRTELARIAGAEPSSLTYNRELGRIFWVDSKEETINYISVHGGAPSLALKSHGIFSLANFKSQVFWTNRYTQMLNSSTAVGLSEGNSIESLSAIMKIAIPTTPKGTS